MEGLGQQGHCDYEDAQSDRSDPKPISSRLRRGETVDQSAHSEFKESTIIQSAPCRSRKSPRPPRRQPRHLY